MSLIPYSTQYLTKKDITRVVDALSSNWIAGGGSITERFEHELAEKTGFQYAVVVNSGTAALHLACQYLFKNKQQVSLPALTFVGTANALLYSNLIPQFVDVNKRSLVTDNADITVDFAGFSTRNGILIDAAHSLRPNMNYHTARGAIVSFHATKNSVVAGEGGAILTDEPEFVSWARQMRNHGLNDNKHLEMLGYNYRMPDFCAALARSQLEDLEVRLARRRQIAQYYIAEFESIPEIELPVWHDEHTFHLFPIRVNNRDEFRKKLEIDEIETRVHYLPVYRHPYYASRGIDPLNFPNTEEAYSRLVSIPIWYGLADEQVDNVIESVKRNLSILGNIVGQLEKDRLADG